MSDGKNLETSPSHQKEEKLTPKENKVPQNFKNLEVTEQTTTENLNDALSNTEIFQNLFSGVEKIFGNPSIRPAFVDKDGDQFTIAISEPKESEKRIRIIVNDNWCSPYIYASISGSNPKSLEYVSIGSKGKGNPDDNGDDKELVDSVLNNIKMYIEECKKYQNQKEKEEEKSQVTVEYKALYDKLPKDKENPLVLKSEHDDMLVYSVPHKFWDHADWFHITCCGESISFVRDWFTGKFTLKARGDKRFTYELNEQETEKILKAINGEEDKSTKFRDCFPKNYIKDIHDARIAQEKIDASFSDDDGLLPA